MKRALLLILTLAAVAAGLLVYFDRLPTALATRIQHWKAEKAEAAASVRKGEPQTAIAVTVARAEPRPFVEITSATGTLVARDEILVGPEIEGLRIVELLAEEGDIVKKGQPLARLVNDTLDAQLAQNDASLSRSKALIAQAKSQIAQAEARLAEAKSAFERAQPLRKSGHLSEALFDQREAAARTAEAQLVSARDAVLSAEAEKAQVEAQRRELAWRREKTLVVAPSDGIISRRSARIGTMAAGAGEPMFRIVARGEIELEAEVPEIHIARLKAGQAARVIVAGIGEVKGSVRLVSPEIDRTTRLGRVRILLGADPRLRIGSFARGEIETARSQGLAVPAAAVLYLNDEPHVQLVVDGRIVSRKVRLGLASGPNVEVVAGLVAGDAVVARSGTFLRDGDGVRAVEQTASVAGGTQ